MDSKPSCRFLDDARWDSDSDTFTFTVFLKKDAAEYRFICKVSRLALEDPAISRGTDDPMRLFRAHKGAIESAVDRKLKALSPQELAQREIRILRNDLRR